MLHAEVAHRTEDHRTTQQTAEAVSLEGGGENRGPASKRRSNEYPVPPWEAVGETPTIIDSSHKTENKKFE
jgi:hypothetical protein